jgi:hypothetical protein
MSKTYKLSDHVIAKIVEILQDGMINQTDITEDFRSMELIVDKKTNKLLHVNEQDTDNDNDKSSN